MQKISQYLYPNRIELLADVATFNVEFTNVYQRNLKIYKGIDNLIEFDVKNADQKRIDLSTLTNIRMNVMDASGKKLPNSPYTVAPAANQTTTGKGLATVTIPDTDLANLTPQYLKYSVTCLKSGADTILYADTRFGAVGVLELAGDAVPVVRGPREFTDFTAEIDLSGIPTYRSSAIPVTYYEAIPTASHSFAVTLSGFTGSIWLEATKRSTINAEAWKGSKIIDSQTFNDFTGTWTPDINSNTNIPVDDFKYFRIAYTTPKANGLGAQFTVTNNNGVYDVKVRAGGTGYAVGSQIKVFGSEVGGANVTHDLIITVTSVDGASGSYPSSYSVSSVSGVSWSGTAITGSGTYIVSGRNITGTVDKVTVS